MGVILILALATTFYSGPRVRLLDACDGEAVSELPIPVMHIPKMDLVVFFAQDRIRPKYTAHQATKSWELTLLTRSCPDRHIDG